MQRKLIDFIDDLSCAGLPGSICPQGVSAEHATDRGPDAFLARRTAELWAGLRRVYYGEVEDSPDLDDLLFPSEPSVKKQKRRTREAVMEFKRDIEETRAWIRQEPPPVPNDLNAPPPILPPRPADDDDDDSPLLPLPVLSVRVSPNDGADGSSPPAISGILSADEDVGSTRDSPRRIILSIRQLRRVLAARETLFKFGIFVPKNDREANASPEAPRWKAGHDLEWLRLNEQVTFETDWTISRMTAEYPLYQKKDIGHLFYVYDYKYSGEHRVRFVFDGSRQGVSTYYETYAPTARQELVRLFHVVLVEENWGLGQYDVPQAFLKALIDYVIFAYPPKGQAAYPGQILRLKRALYGGKQSAYLWFTMINEFILSLDFVASSLDSCFYRRDDAMIDDHSSCFVTIFALGLLTLFGKRFMQLSTRNLALRLLLVTDFLA
jgi:hypothetical protein